MADDFYEPEVADPGEGDLFGALEAVTLGKWPQKIIDGATEIEVVPKSQLDHARTLLKRWLEECAAMGGGPRAQLTQDTLDALGRLAFDEEHDAR